MGVFLGERLVTLGAEYQEVLKIRKPKNIDQVVIYLASDSGEVTYKVTGRIANSSLDPTGSDDTYDWDLPKDEGELTEETEFTLGESSATREIVEEHWTHLIVKAKGDGCILYVKASGG